MPDDDVRTLRAAAHPLRLRILSLLTAQAMSAAEIARELGITHANASYHLRVLARAGEVVEAGEEKVRGGVARRYRHPWDSPDRAPGELAGQVQAMGHELVRRYAEQAPGRRYLCDAELWVDEETWLRALALVEEACRLVHDGARAPRSPGSRRTNLTIAGFGMRA